MIWYDMIRHECDMTWYGIIRYYLAWHDMIWFGMVLLCGYEKMWLMHTICGLSYDIAKANNEVAGE